MGGHEDGVHSSGRLGLMGLGLGMTQRRKKSNWDGNVELEPIAVQEERYRQHIAALIKTVLEIDEKLFKNNPGSEAL